MMYASSPLHTVVPISLPQLHSSGMKANLFHYQFSTTLCQNLGGMLCSLGSEFLWMWASESVVGRRGSPETGSSSHTSCQVRLMTDTSPGAQSCVLVSFLSHLDYVWRQQACVRWLVPPFLLSFTNEHLYQEPGKSAQQILGSYWIQNDRETSL